MRTSLPVEHLFTLRADIVLGGLLTGGPAGDRVMMAANSGYFTGPRLRGTITPPGGDWVTRRPGGVGLLDIRLLLHTDDAALILLTATGISLDSGRDIKIVPRFETGATEYAWLNRLQAVALGAVGEGHVEYEVYAIAV
jgi:hypothetical protein